MPKICKACSNNVFGGGYCKNHQYMRTDKKPPKPKEQKPIKQVSNKQAIKNQQYSKERKLFLAENPLCKANLPNCTKIATDVHHKRGRGEFFLKQETWIGLCRTCHNRVEENPDEAKQLGLSESRLNI
jgi:hypothetical protein